MKSFSFILLLFFSQIDLERQIDFLRGNPDKSDSIISLWVEAKDEVFPGLMNIFKGKRTDIFIKQKIAIAFGKMGKKDALPYLYKELKSSSSILRENCVRAIGEIGDSTSFDKILPLLNDKNDAVRGAVIYSLSKINLKRAKPYLIKSLNDPSFLNRVNAILFLSKTHKKDVIHYLVSLKDDPNPFVRRGVAKALGEFKDSASLKALKTLIKDKDPGVRREALLSIKKTFSERTFALLQDFINDPDISVRETASEILKNFPPDLSLPILYEFLSDPSERIREKSREIIDKIKNKEKGFVKILKGDYPLKEKRWAFQNLVRHLDRERIMKLLTEIYTKEKIVKMIEGKYEKGMSMEEVYISLGKPSRRRKLGKVEEWDYDKLKVTLRFKDKILREIKSINF